MTRTQTHTDCVHMADSAGEEPTAPVHSAPSISDANALWQRWQGFLQQSSTYRELLAEQQAGWQCKDLDVVYSAIVKENAGGPTSFAKADPGLLCRRYRLHASKILARAHPALFARSCSTLGAKPNQFLDLGSAPGGVSHFLHSDLNWTGTAVTLSPEHGGIPMHPVHARTESLRICYADLRNETEVAASLEQHVKANERPFRFVNCGAVQDHGQREQEKPTDGASTVVVIGDLLVAQLRVAFRYVQDGGDVMFVFGSTKSGAFFLLLSLLQPVVDQITLLETLFVVKAPVYVLLSGVHPSRVPDALWDRLTGPSTYWLLDEPESWDQAVASFALYGPQLEHIWHLATGVLKDRRIRASQQRDTGVKRGRDIV